MGTGPFGLTALGYNLQRIPDFRAALDASITQAFPGANVAVQSTFGQMIGIMAGALAEMDERVFKMFQAGQLNAAEGQTLDNIGAIMGITRATGETDTVYRNRMLAVGLLNATPQNSAVGLCAALRALDGVTLVSVVSDPANCGYQVVILGGDDTQIAETIFAFHPAGVNILGTTEVLVESGCGFCQSIRFTRPNLINVCVRLDIELLSGPCDCDVSATAQFEDAVFQFFTGSTGDACAPSLGLTLQLESFYEPLIPVQPVRIVSAEFSSDGGTTYAPGPLVLADTDYPVWNRQCIEISFV